MKKQFSPEIEQFLAGLDADIFNLVEFQRPPRKRQLRKRQPRLTVTLSPEVYEKLQAYATRHNKSISEVASAKLDLILPTPEDEAEFEILSAMYDAQQCGVSQYVN